MYISCHVLYADLCKFSRVSFSPFTGDVLKEKKTNVPTSRVFTCSGVEFKWANILSKLQNMCQNVLLCPYVCKTSLSEVHIAILSYTKLYNNPVYSCSMYACLSFVKEICDLQVGKSVVVQTNRSNQVAFLKRSPDENRIPYIQVCMLIYILNKNTLDLKSVSLEVE